mmetsp:Transcript_8152/g.14521  ORF Transcript_8152/g.14521 Transcript_8152/m.14521 type:complete len:100 (-) Transcript_8152:276-575(-)
MADNMQGAPQSQGGQYRLFVGNLSWSTTDQSLMRAFQDAVGQEQVSDAKVIMDRYSGRSRGFGFVSFVNEDACEKALGMMNGTSVDGREVRVDRASSRQ